MGGAASRAGDDAPEAIEVAALETLRLNWGSAWDIGCGGGRWQAARRGVAGPVLTRASADGLELALRAGYGRLR
jgi:hypothetical protein